jgi:hypothetical protein
LESFSGKYWRLIGSLEAKGVRAKWDSLFMKEQCKRMLSRIITAIDA